MTICTESFFYGVKMYTKDEVEKATLEYFNGDELATNVWISKYALRDNENNLLEKTPDDMHRRLAKEFARIEKNKFSNPLTENEIYEYLKGFKRIVLQGSPMYGIGNKYQYVTSSSCYTIPSPHDSYLGIMFLDTQITQISCRRGGVGWDMSTLRPKNMKVTNAAGSTTGVISFMHRYSNTVREIAQFGRRAASLQSLRVEHPEILDFIKCKNDDTSITGSNISVQFTDDFMNSVINNIEKFTLEWPVDRQPAELPKCIMDVITQDIWNSFVENTWNRAEPGAIFIDTVHRRSTSAPYNGFKEVACNPCLTYDTLVYVADGRGVVKIGDLAKKGDDVDVFCLNNKNNIVIRKMRHPRLTGKKEKIYKITLDDGSSIKCTANHKLLLNNGQYIEAKNLQKEDSLYLITRFEASIKDIFPKANANSQDYYWLQNGYKKTNKSEHRIIAEHNYGTIEKHNVVHHIDYNGKNNAFENLRIMTTKDHNVLHCRNMLGDKNPMRRAHVEWSKEKWDKYRKNQSKASKGKNNGRYINISQKEYFNHAISLTTQLNRRFSIKEWIQYCKQNGLPYGSKYRVTKYNNSYIEFAKQAAAYCGLENADVDPRVIKTQYKMINSGYSTKIVDGFVHVERVCEQCGQNFWIEHLRRESCFCSSKCVSRYIQNDKKTCAKIRFTRKIHEDNKKQIKEKQQIEIYKRLKSILDRNPLKKEWRVECAKNSIPFRIGKHSRFKTYTELKEFASNTNHKVISVEFDGYEDVYNGTVDEFHNFLIGGFIGTTENNKPKQSFVVNLQCGEQYLPEYGCCRLLAINLYSYVKNKFTTNAHFDYQTFNDDVKIMQRLADDMVDLDIECMDRIIEKIKSDPEPEEVKKIGLDLWTQIRERSLQDRRTGCGIVGLADCLAALNIKYDSKQSIEKCNSIFETFKNSAYASSIEMAKEVGPFPIYDYKLDKQSDFIQELNEQLQKDMKKYGRRNMTLLTIAPTGSVSLLTQTSSGIEPVFMLEYTRRKKINPSEKDVKVDFTDKTGDKWSEYKVYHRGFLDWMKVSGKDKIENSPYYNALAHEIDYVKKVHLQATIQKHIDNSISVTTNLPANISKEKVSELYLLAYKLGCKGFTIYRDGCRSGVLVSQSIKPFPKDRPKELPCDVHHISIKGQQYFILVGLIDGRPYEVFAGRNGFLPQTIKTGTIIRKRKNFYKAVFDECDGEELSPITATTNEMEECVTRLTSGLLRTGADMYFVVKQLEKVGERQTDMHSFARSVARALKKYIPDGTKESGQCEECGAESLIRQDGCVSCSLCGHSKCS
jgi:ribonucleotide reductase alpha subunit